MHWVAELQLEVTDVTGHRTVTVDKLPFRLGRGTGNDLRLSSGEVSRVHAEIVTTEEAWPTNTRERLRWASGTCFAYRCGW